MIGTCLTMALKTLIYNPHLRLYTIWSQHPGNLIGDLLVGEEVVKFLHEILLLLIRDIALAEAAFIDIHYLISSTAIECELNGGLEGDKFLHACHVDAVIVGISHLRAGTYHHDAARMETVENADDALAQGGAAHDGIVDDHQIVLIRIERTVGDVVYVCRKVVARVGLGDEGAQLYILPGHLLGADAAREDAGELVGGEAAVGLDDPAGLLRIQMFVQTLHHAIEGGFGSVGDI